MDFSLSGSQRDLQSSVRNIAENIFAPEEHRWESDPSYSVEALKKLGENDLLGLNISPTYGGIGLTPFDSALCIEEMAKVSPPAAMLMACNSIGQAYYIEHFAREELRQRFLPGVCAGEATVSIAISEPGAGTAATAMTTVGEQRGDKIVINGHKHYVSLATTSSVFIVYVRLNETKGAGGIGAVLVERNAPGFKIARLSRNMGGGLQADLTFDNCEVPADQLLVGAGAFAKLTHCYNLERVGACAALVGLATGVHQRALDYVKMREQFGRPLIDFQAVQLKISDMAIQLEAARLMVYRALNNTPDGMPTALDASMTKIFVNDTARMVTDQAIQLFGAAGYLCETGIERFFRIARGYSIAGGPLDIHRVMVAGWLAGRRFSQWPSAKGA